MRKDPCQELCGRFPPQPLRNSGVVDTRREHPAERPEKALRDDFLKCWRPRIDLITSETRYCLVEKSNFQRIGYRVKKSGGNPPGERFHGLVASSSPAVLTLQSFVESGIREEMRTIASNACGVLNQWPRQIGLAFADGDLRPGHERGHRVTP